MSQIAARGSDEDDEVVVSFNQNSRSLSVGLENKSALYLLTNCDTRLEKFYEGTHRGLFIIERLFDSSLLAIVSRSARRKLLVYHTKRKNEICNYSYSNSILAVKINRKRLVVCLEDTLFVHNLSDMRVVHTIRETPSNPGGLIALSSDEERNYLAYPGNAHTGELQLFDVENFTGRIMIPAHDNPLAAFAFNMTATEVATASERGTVIRVFSTVNGAKLYELRRGLKRCVQIASLAFSTCGQYLVSTSNTETVHIFRFDRNETNTDGQDSWVGYFSKAVTNYLPSQMTTYLTMERAFAWVTMKEPGKKLKCAITRIEKELRLLIASNDGMLYVYAVPEASNNECQLLKKYDLRLDDCGIVDKAESSSSRAASTDDDAGAAGGLEAAAQDDAQSTGSSDSRKKIRPEIVTDDEVDTSTLIE